MQNRLQSQKIDHETRLAPLAVTEFDVVLAYPNPQLDRAAFLTIYSERAAERRGRAWFFALEAKKVRSDGAAFGQQPHITVVIPAIGEPIAIGISLQIVKSRGGRTPARIERLFVLSRTPHRTKPGRARDHEQCKQQAPRSMNQLPHDDSSPTYRLPHSGYASGEARPTSQEKCPAAALHLRFVAALLAGGLSQGTAGHGHKQRRLQF